MKKRVHVIVSGLVQGVSFRRYTKEEAVKNGVNGWVKNLSDGRVEAVFEGNEENVKKMIEFCRAGSPNAFISNIKVIQEDIKNEKTGFEIKY